MEEENKILSLSIEIGHNFEDSKFVDIPLDKNFQKEIKNLLKLKNGK